MIRHTTWKRRLRSFWKDRAGNVAMVFGLSVLPLSFATGAAIDYGRRSSAKTQLDAALDAAMLSVVSRKTNTFDSAMLAGMETQFRDEAAKVPGATVTDFTSAQTSTTDSVGVTASYQAKVTTTLTKILGFDTMPLSGNAAASRKATQYIDFYLLLDNSPSMGLAATDQDVANMKKVTSDKCAFACHKHTFDKNGKITGDDPKDYYTIAKKNNIRLRIHNLRDAVANLVDTAKATMKLTDQYRMELWTFSDTATKLSSLTANLTQTKTDSAAIDLAYSLYGDPDNQTSYQSALPKMDSTVPSSGTGLTASSPIRFLFFVTDGVQDTPVGSMKKTVETTGGKYVHSDRYISPLNPSLCNAMKSRGVRIGIIYTAYLPIPDNDFYNSYVKPFEGSIPTNLKSCATSGLFFPVSTGGDINAAMQTLFQTAIASVRITN